METRGPWGKGILRSRRPWRLSVTIAAYGSFYLEQTPSPPGAKVQILLPRTQPERLIGR